MKRNIGIWLALCLAMAMGTASAQQAEEARTGFDPAVLTEGFLSAHPDLRWRNEGLAAYEKQDYAQAMTFFKRAATHADKPSQAIIAEMYWKGQGVPRDRPLAYAWMDVAAERLYHDFVVYRESYWAALDEAGREDALARGQAVLAEYGDDAAKPRLERVLKRAKRNTTGSRLGFVGNLEIIPQTGPFAGTGMRLRGDEYYADKYWEPTQYWRLQDDIWKAPLRTRVRVGDVETVPRAGDAGEGDAPGNDE